eukprot:538518-Amphidinium_carterae.2
MDGEGDLRFYGSRSPSPKTGLSGGGCGGRDWRGRWDFCGGGWQLLRRQLHDEGLSTPFTRAPRGSPLGRR